MRQRRDMDPVYYEARRDHAWYLRTEEGLTYKQIGKRMGIAFSRAYRLVTNYRWNEATRSYDNPKRGRGEEI